MEFTPSKKGQFKRLSADKKSKARVDFWGNWEKVEKKEKKNAKCP